MMTPPTETPTRDAAAEDRPATSRTPPCRPRGWYPVPVVVWLGANGCPYSSRSAIGHVAGRFSMVDAGRGRLWPLADILPVATLCAPIRRSGEPFRRLAPAAPISRSRPGFRFGRSPHRAGRGVGVGVGPAGDGRFRDGDRGLARSRAADPRRGRFGRHRHLRSPAGRRRVVF